MIAVKILLALLCWSVIASVVVIFACALSSMLTSRGEYHEDFTERDDGN